MKKVKTARQMERHLKGMANHYRIGILLLIGENGTMTLESIISELGIVAIRKNIRPIFKIISNRLIKLFNNTLTNWSL